jgi:peroxiredoxin
MGIRSLRFASIIENGVFKVLEVDEKGLDKSSVENILTFL